MIFTTHTWALILWWLDQTDWEWRVRLLAHRKWWRAAQLHKGYYVTDVSIIPSVPDGDFILGWAWYGGAGSPVTGNVQQEPLPYSGLGDSWSCAFIHIQGGAPLASSCEPVFKNDMPAVSTKGCIASVNRLGPWTYEPCERRGVYQKATAVPTCSPATASPG